MRWIERTHLAIRRRQTPLTNGLWLAARAVQRFEVPAPGPVYGALYRAWQFGQLVAETSRRTLLYQPMFRSQCDSVGKRLYMYGGMPYLYGGLRLRIGDDCKINARTSFVSSKVLDEPVLEIGDHSSIGWQVTISVAERVTIGRHVRIANNVLICDNPGHPLDAEARRTEPVTREQIRPVRIDDDVWIGTGAMVMPGVHIGRGSVIAAGSVVTRDVPADVVAAGAPARVVRTLRHDSDNDRVLTLEKDGDTAVRRGECHVA